MTIYEYAEVLKWREMGNELTEKAFNICLDLREHLKGDNNGLD